MNNLKKTTVVLTALAMAACNGGGSAGNGGSSLEKLGANIAGMVSESSSTLSVQNLSSYDKMKMKIFGSENENSAMAVSGCTVTAFDMVTGEQKGNSVTTDSAGQYTITGVASGETYKVVADCGSFTLANVSTADEVDPDEKEREVTNPLTSLMATMIVKNIMEQLEGTLSALPESLKKTLMKTIAPVVLTAVKSAVEESVNNGTLIPPTTTEAKNLSDNLKEQKPASELNTAITTVYDENTKPLPPAIKDSGKTAAAQAGALKDCDSTGVTDHAAQEKICTKSMINMMYNALGFSVGLNVVAAGSGGTGVFAGEACNSSNTTLTSFFPNANFISGGEIPTGYCLVEPKFARSDRNNEEKSGDGGGPTFIESGLIESNQVTGYLTMLGKAMYNKYSYNLGSIDKFVFGYDEDKAGMNTRIFQIRKNFNHESGSDKSYYYLASNSQWTAMGEGIQPYSLNLLDESSAWDWTPGSNPETGEADLITAIGAGKATNLAKTIFSKKFGGPVPTVQQIESMLNESRTHKEYNPTGGKEFHVLFSQNPKWEVPKAGSTSGEMIRPCEDNDPTTACEGATDTTPQVIVRFTLGDKQASGIRPLATVALPEADANCATSITQLAQTGKHACYYLEPIYSRFGFSGIFNIIRTFDGQAFKNELNERRAIKVYSGADCSAEGAPSNCTANDVFEGTVKWGEDVAFSATGEVTSTVSSLVGTSMYNEFWEPSTNGWRPGVVAKWENGQGIPLELTGSVDLSATPSVTGMGHQFKSPSSTGPRYNVVIHRDCSNTEGSICNPSTNNAKFYLYDVETGSAVTNSEVCADYVNCTAWANKARVFSCEGEMPNMTCSEKATPLFDAAALDTILGSDANLVKNYFIPNGPVLNPNWKCEFEPFFADGNNNGKLDCGSSGPINGDKTFSGMWEVQNAYMKCGQTDSCQNLNIMPRENAYQFADPVGPKKLLTTAFNGWFDGKHSITSSTELNALQVFSLIFMFFEEGGSNGTHIDNMDSTDANQEYAYEFYSPIMKSGNVEKWNQAFGKAVENYKVSSSAPTPTPTPNAQSIKK